MLFILLMAIAPAGSPAHGKNPPAVHVPLDQIAPLRIDPIHYERLSKEIVLSDAQRNRMDQLYAAYHTSLNQLHREVIRQSGEALVEVMAHAETQGAFDIDTFGREQAANILQKGHRLIREARSRADEQFMHFEQDLRSILTDEQQASWAGVRRAIRRDLLLGRRLPPSARFDFFRHADLINLYQAASSEGGELAALKRLAAVSNDSSRRHRHKVVRKILDLLHQYEMQLDELLERNRQARNEAIMRMELAVMSGRTERVSVHHQRAVRTWRQIHHLTRDTAEAVGYAALPIVGEHARLQWMSRFWRAQCPDLLAPDSAEIMFRWALDLDGLDKAHHRRVERLRDHYEERRYAVWRRAVCVRTEINETQHLLLGNVETILVERHTPAELQDIESERDSLARDAVHRLRSALPSQFVESFDQHLDAVRERGYDNRRVRY